MGYRSNVVIAIKQSKADELDDLLKGKKFPELFTEDWVKTHVDGDTKYFVFDDIKWYESYGDVIEVNNYLDAMPEECYGFMRTGEEDGDTEERGNPYSFGIELHRSISYPDGSI